MVRLKYLSIPAVVLGSYCARRMYVARIRGGL